MKFSDLKPSQRFRFKFDERIWTKSLDRMAEREFEERYIFASTEVFPVKENEQEDSKKVEEQSLWDYLQKQEKNS